MPGIDYDEAVRQMRASLAGSVDLATEARQARDGAEALRRRGDIARAREFEEKARDARAALAGRDSGLMVLRSEALAAASDEIARLRAEAEAGRDPATRTADELERQRLVASGQNGDDLAAQAEAMLAAGQPRRAALLLAAAEDRGAHMTSGLRAAVEAALDEAVPERRKALAVEADVNAAVAEIDALRLRFLAASGLGLDPDTGAAGNGSDTQVASARIAAKVAEFTVAQSTGAAYHPADEDLVTGDPGPTPGMWAELDRARSLSGKAVRS